MIFWLESAITRNLAGICNNPEWHVQKIIWFSLLAQPITAIRDAHELYFIDLFLATSSSTTGVVSVFFKSSKWQLDIVQQ